ncbi:MAG: hypothetical protein ACI9OJ_003276, partial [Myxococcota bacterium]
DDGNTCTIDFCDPFTGACVHDNDPSCQGLGSNCATNEDCDFGNLCFHSECDAGVDRCSMRAVNCNDYNPCTADSCDPATGCVFVLKPGCSNNKCDTSADCDDDDTCTEESCVLNNCIYEDVPNCPQVYCQGDVGCSDGSTCTVDTCLPIGECQFTTVACTSSAGCQGFFGNCIEGYGCNFFADPECSTACEADADCVTGNACLPATCQGNQCVVEYSDSPTEGTDGCFDDNDFTHDICNPDTTLCEFPANPAGDQGCTSDADCPDLGVSACAPPRCQTGECVQTVIPCNDYDPCTADSCNLSTKACVFAPIAGCAGCTTNASCDDGDACTEDTCGTDSNCEFSAIDGCQPCSSNADCQLAVPNACITPVCNGTTSRCEFIELDPCVECPFGFPGAAENCVDVDGCTDDICRPDGICENVPNPNAATCPACVPTEQLVCPCSTNHDCNDGEPCTLNRCVYNDSSNTDGECIFPPVVEEGFVAECPQTCSADMDCYDNNACTVDRCLPAGTCEWTETDCVDGKACTVDHTCIETQGCRYFPPQFGCVAECDIDADCDTGSACYDAFCLGGSCATQAKACDDGIPATRDFCDPADGTCQAIPEAGWNGCADETDCDDNNACTDDQCLGNGSCFYLPIECNDYAFCTTDTCSAAEGCKFTQQPDCASGCATDDAQCDDGDTCTLDQCDSDNGFCIHTFDPTCQKKGCTQDLECADKNACTYERCFEGFCESYAVQCNDGLACTLDRQPDSGGQDTPPVACSPLTGCELEADLDCAAPCSADADCDTGELCLPGSCIGGVCNVIPVLCEDGNVGTFNYCDSADGTCKTVAAPDNDAIPCDPEVEDDEEVACDDGNACTLPDCEDGHCIMSSAQCNDLNPCTIDSCDTQAGCQFIQIPSCGGCTTDEQCNNFDACKNNSCNLETGNCEDTVIPGCQACAKLSQAVDCNDGDACTKDQCASDNTCFSQPIDTPECQGTPGCTVDADCQGGDRCTLYECDDATGECIDKKLVCADDNPCTLNGAAQCQPNYGCQPDIDATCGGLSCLTPADCPFIDACVTPTCPPSTSQCGAIDKVCDDLDPATRDYCDSEIGCVFENFAPGNWSGCTEDADCGGDMCTQRFCEIEDGQTVGHCGQQALPCFDSNPCTTDTCSPSTGCVFDTINNCQGCSINADCDDGDSCTEDNCEGVGNCTHTPSPACL